MPRNLLLEAKREIRVLQERCRELESGLNALKEENKQLREEKSNSSHQVGDFEVPAATTFHLKLKKRLSLILVQLVSCLL